MSVITETWPQADSSDISTGSDLGTWNEDSADMLVAGNALNPTATDPMWGRETGGVATADHKCTATMNIVVGAGTRAGGPTCRKTNDTARTFYHATYKRVTASFARGLDKWVAGTLTSLASDTTDAGAGDLTVFVKAIGDQISADFAGFALGPVTDSAIAGNTRGGYGMRGAGANTALMKDWQLEDVAAGGPKGPLSNPLAGPFGGPI